MGHEGMSGWAMGFGGMGILFWIVLVLAAAIVLMAAAYVSARWSARTTRAPKR